MRACGKRCNFRGLRLSLANLVATPPGLRSLKPCFRYRCTANTIAARSTRGCGPLVESRHASTTLSGCGLNGRSRTGVSFSETRAKERARERQRSDRTRATNLPGVARHVGEDLTWRTDLVCRQEGVRDVFEQPS